MSEQTDPKTGKKAPDPATSYERAKPKQESPSGSLSEKPVSKGKQQDHLDRNAAPAAPKKNN